LLDGACDGMRLSATRCTVGEDGGVVSIQNTVQQRFCCSLVYFSLRCIFIEDPVEAECLIFDSFA
jgi:hypothetical protein